MNNYQTEQPHRCPQHGDYSEYVRCVQFTAIPSDDVWYLAFYLCPQGNHEFDVPVEWHKGIDA